VGDEGLCRGQRIVGVLLCRFRALMDKWRRFACSLNFAQNGWFWIWSFEKAV
jgi:hypothetical protein